MRIEHLQYIVEIAQLGSISLAAERLYITQPSLSMALNSLEKELGVVIFIRSRQGAKLTEQGEMIVLQAKEILNKIDQLKINANTISSNLSGNFFVSAIPSVCLTILPKAIAAFKLRHPNVKLSLTIDGGYKVIQAVTSGKSDLGIVAVPVILAEKDSRLKALEENLYAEKLYYDEILPCVSKHSPLSLYDTVDPQDLLEHAFVLYKPGYLLTDYIVNHFKSYGNVDVLLLTENSEIAKKMIVLNNAVGFFTKRSLLEDPYVRCGDIKPLQLRSVNFDIYYMAIKEKKHFSSAYEEFMRILKSFCD